MLIAELFAGKLFADEMLADEMLISEMLNLARLDLANAEKIADEMLAVGVQCCRCRWSAMLRLEPNGCQNGALGGGKRSTEPRDSGVSSVARALDDAARRSEAL